MSELIEAVGTIIAAALTLCVLSYLLGLKVLYRLVLHLLIGVGVVYAIFVAWQSVIYPDVVSPLQYALAGDVQDVARTGIAGLGVVLGVLLWCKLSRLLAWLGNVSVGYLVGVGLGVAAGGAVIGTLYAQGAATAGIGNADTWSVLIGAVITLTVLLSFSFTFAWDKGPLKLVTQFVQGLSAIGRFFVYAALGAAFAGVYVASVSVLIGQVQFLLSAWPSVGVALANLGISF